MLLGGAREWYRGSWWVVGEAFEARAAPREAVGRAELALEGEPEIGPI